MSTPTPESGPKLGVSPDTNDVEQRHDPLSAAIEADFMTIALGALARADGYLAEEELRQPSDRI